MALHKQYPIQIAISTIFLAIVIALGVILSWQSYNKTSDIMLNSADELYERITNELSLDFKATYGSIRSGLYQFRLTPLIHAKTFNERSIYLANFKAILNADQSLYSVGIGYANGDYLGAHIINTEFKRKKYQVPADSSFIALYLKKTETEGGFEKGKLYTIYYDDELNEISRNSGVATQFDPRTRP